MWLKWRRAYLKKGPTWRGGPRWPPEAETKGEELERKRDETQNKKRRRSAEDGDGQGENEGSRRGAGGWRRS